MAVYSAFRRTHPQVAVEVSYGSSGALFQQVANGAPVDLYLSADVGYPHRLVEAGLVGSDQVFPYAVGRPVIWAGEGSPVDPDQGITAVRRAERVAIANPAHAPYGRAAQAALTAAGLYDEVADRLVRGDSVAQAAEFVRTGNAEVGIVAHSQVVAPPLAGVGRWREVDPGLYPPLVQAGAVLPGASPAAGDLREFLTAEAGADVLRRYGFEAPPG